MQRIKQPLLTQMSSGHPELCYVCLEHLELLLCRAPSLLSESHTSFYIRYNDPSYVKAKKLELLTSICDDANLEQICDELAAYVTDVDVEMARGALQAIGRIGLKHSNSSEHVMSMLLLFLDLDVEHVSAGTMVVIQDMLRKYPALSERVVPRIPTLIESGVFDAEPEARCALLWMLGLYGAQIDDSPYVLEPMIENYDNETSSAIKLQLLTTAVQLFFARPPECQKMLGRLLKKVIDEEVHMDIHDRALLYYRLLKSSVDEAKRVICSPQAPIEQDDARDPVIVEQLLEEFNSLATIYHASTPFVLFKLNPVNLLNT